MLDEEEMEEERRLCYVGITRAKERLYLTRAYHRMLWGNSQYNCESRFIKEIPDELLNTGMGEKSLSPEAPSGQKDFTAPARPMGSSNLLNLGDKVQHAKFGTGVIVKTDGLGENMEISVAFPNNGIKNFIVKYAPIRKI